MMMPLLLLSLAVSGTGVTPAKVRSLNFNDADYPTAAVRRGEEGGVRLRVLVAPSGKAEQCSVVQSSGSEDLDHVSCALILQRTRFIPANDANGEPVYGLIDIPLSWRIPALSSRLPPIPSLPPTLELTVSRLPDGQGPSVDADVDLEVNESGGVTVCSVPDKSEAPTLAALVCRSGPELWPAQIVRNSAGVAVPYVTVRKVRFTVG